VNRLTLVCTAAVLLLLASGCGLGRSHSTAETTTTATTTTATAAPTTLTIFRVENGKLRAESVSVAHTDAPATAALAALGLPATVTIANGTATVDLAQATADEVAEIVYTLTAFPSVQHVDVAGRTGLTRDDVAGYLPVIFIESPAAGATVGKSFHVTGSAMVFEATLVVELVSAGTVVQKNTVTASEGAPGRGTFDTVLQAPGTGPARIVAFAPSAADGSPQHQVEVPVTVAATP
jgi:Immunoglobulin-like domain of bacterial spore germination